MFLFSATEAVILLKVKLGKPARTQYGEMQAITTLNRSQSAVAEVCLLPSAAVLVGLSSSLC